MKVLGKLFTKQAIISAVLIISIVTITMFSSYAFYFKVDPSEVAQSINTDNLRLSFSNNGYDQQINIDKIIIYSDQDALDNKIEPYILSIFNRKNLPVRFKLYLKNTSIAENIVVDNIDYENLVPRKYIKYQINDEEIKLLNDDENIEIYVGSVGANNQIADELSIKVWVSDNLPESELNKKIHLKFEIEELPRNIFGEEDSLVNTIINKIGTIAQIEDNTPSKFSLSSIENEGMFVTKDNDGNSYYFRGSILNNNLSFGQTENETPLLWKIVRINGDKSVRIVLNEIHLDQDELLKTNYNLIENANAFVGYSYGEVTNLDPSIVHSNISYSNAKINLEKWFEKYFINTINMNYIVDSTFCNDRTIISGTGLGNEKTYYGSYQRINHEIGNFTPSLLCSLDKDKLSKENSLLYPIGLLTADELVFAGATSNIKNSLFYLASKNNYWLLSPAYYNRGAYIYLMSVNNGLREEKVTKVNYLRPVINIKGDSIVIFGDGSLDNPYYLDIKEKMVDN